VVLSSCDPEPVPDEQGQPLDSVSVQAAALGLRAAPGSFQLRLVRTEASSAVPLANLSSLITFLERRLGGATRWACAVPGAGELELTGAAMMRQAG
jgi:hypothetical protein